MVEFKEKVLPAVILIAALLLSLGTGLISGRLIHPFYAGDEVYQIPMILHTLHPELFANDYFLLQHTLLFPQSSNLVMLGFISIFQNIFLAYLIASILFFSILILGMYYFGLYLSGDKKIASVYALLGIFIRFALGGIGFGISTGILVPRDIVLAFVPWILIIFLGNYCKPKKMALLFFGIGILANVHALSSLHLVMILFLAMIIFAGRKLITIQRLLTVYLVSGIGFVIGAIPYLLFFFSSQHQLPGLDLLAFRSEHVLISQLITPHSNILAVFLITLVPFILAGALGMLFWKKELLAKKEFKKMGATFAIAIVIFLLAFLQAIPTLQNSAISLQFLRASVFFYFFLLFFAAFAIVKFIESKKLEFKAIGAVLFLFCLFPAGIYLNSTFTKLAGNPCTDLSAELQNVCQLKADNSVNIQSKWNSFEELTSFAKNNSPASALFLVPPNEFSVFRVYAQRPVIVVTKDGAPIIFSKEYADQWLQTYREVLQAYDTNSEQTFANVKQKYTFDFIVVAKAKNKLNYPVVFENADYMIYKP